MIKSKSFGRLEKAVYTDYAQWHVPMVLGEIDNTLIVYVERKEVYDQGHYVFGFSYNNKLADVIFLLPTFSLKSTNILFFHLAGQLHKLLVA